MDTGPDRTEATVTARTVAEVSTLLLERGWTMCSAESCTGGLLSAACTDRPGSSEWFERGFVTYSNAAKIELLGVPAALIETHGAVSAEVAEAMALGALRSSHAQVAIAVTGIAGPAGGGIDKPVGTVWFGCALLQRPSVSLRCRFDGDRAAVRAQAVVTALTLLRDQLHTS